jgi:putative RNA 2'-phosphotransferase
MDAAHSFIWRPRRSTERLIDKKGLGRNPQVAPEAANDEERVKTLKNCSQHGTFRGEMCPVCDDEGKFLMSEDELNSVGRILAGVLRHFPEKFDLDMDLNGWVDIRDVAEEIRHRKRNLHWLRVHHVKAIADTDPKGRYQVEGNRVRATYGHSVDVELDHPTDNVPQSLFYPSTQEELDMLLDNGITPSDRRYVHLSLTYDDAYNAGVHRTEDPQILEIDAAAALMSDVYIGQAGPTVFVTRGVPPDFVEIAVEPEGFVPPDPPERMVPRRERINEMDD